jgi:hypothetical protein
MCLEQKKQHYCSFHIQEFQNTRIEKQLSNFSDWGNSRPCKEHCCMGPLVHNQLLVLRVIKGCTKFLPIDWLYSFLEWLSCPFVSTWNLTSTHMQPRKTSLFLVTDFTQGMNRALLPSLVFLSMFNLFPSPGFYLDECYQKKHADHL